MSRFIVPYASRNRVSTPIVGESLTKQAHRDDCDVNNIVRRWQQTEVDPRDPKRQGQYLDVSSIPDYADSVLRLNAAYDIFGSLDAKTRKSFNNSLGEFINYANDPNNVDSLVKMGVLQLKEEVAKEGEAPHHHGNLAPAGDEAKK